MFYTISSTLTFEFLSLQKQLCQCKKTINGTSVEMSWKYCFMLNSNRFFRSSVSQSSESSGNDWSKFAKTIRSMAATRTIQAKSRSDCWGGKKTLHVFATECQRRESSFSLQRSRCPKTYEQRWNLGIQQNLHTVHSIIRIRFANLDGSA